MFNSAQNNTKIISAAVLTVCVDPDMTDTIVQIAESMPWLVVSADFETYISPVRRPHLGQQIKSTNGCVAIVDFDEDSEQAVETTRYLQQIFAGKIVVIALSSSQDPNLLLMAMRAGCSEFLTKPLDESALHEALKRVDHTWALNEVKEPSMGSVLSFFGAKGGVGSTTLAVHLATYLVECHQKKTLLIDVHPQLGHVCVYLGIDGAQNHFDEVVRNVNRLDSDLLRGFVAKHSSGLEVLSSPDISSDPQMLDGEAVAKTLAFLRTEYEYVIVDCPMSLDETNLAVIDSSTQVYLVATPEIGAVRDLSRHVDKLTQSQYTTDKMHVVINRFSSRYAVSIEQIEKAIHLPVAIKLPNSYTELVRSVNLGEPISSKRKSEFSIQFTKWVSSLIDAPGVAAAPSAAPKKSVFARWK